MSQNSFAGELWHKIMYLRNEVRLPVTVHMSRCVYTHSVLWRWDLGNWEWQWSRGQTRRTKHNSETWWVGGVPCWCWSSSFSPPAATEMAFVVPASHEVSCQALVSGELCIASWIALAIHSESNTSLKYHIPTEFISLCGHLNNQLLHVVWPFAFVLWWYD